MRALWRIPSDRYKWLARHEAAGGDGLADRSRVPQGCPHRTSEAHEALIVAARLEYGWDAKKGLLQKHRRRQRWAHPGATPVATHRPNQIWPADFKGQFRLGVYVAQVFTEKRRPTRWSRREYGAAAPRP